jgi:hypothetical protein
MAAVSNTPIGTIKAGPAQCHAKGIMDSMIPKAMSGPMMGSATSRKSPELHRVWSEVISFLPGIAAGITRPGLPKPPYKDPNNSPIIPGAFAGDGSQASDRRFRKTNCLRGDNAGQTSFHRVTASAVLSAWRSHIAFGTRKASAKGETPPSPRWRQTPPHSKGRKRKSHGRRANVWHSSPRTIS